jgi:hypothetical protein
MSFSIGPCGCCGKEADIHMVIALLRRVGLGPWSTAIPGAPGDPLPTAPLPAQLPPLFTPLPLGPLNPFYDSPNAGTYIPAIQHIEPLYLACTTTIAWNDGHTYQTTVTLDAAYADLTVVSNAARIPSQVNVPAGKTSANPTWQITDYFVTYNDQPPQPWPPNTVYGPAPDQNPIGIISPDGLTFTLGFENENYDNGDGTFTYYIGGKLTWQLDPTTAKHLSDYAAICSGFLGEATLQDGTLAPGKTYPIANITDPATKLPAQARLRYFCEFPKTASDPTLWLYTNALVVTRTRAGYAYGGDGYNLAPGYLINLDWADWNSSSLSYGDGTSAVSFPCNATIALDLVTSLPLTRIHARFPLAAHGMVLNQGMPGAPAAMSAPYIFSVKSSLRSQAALGATNLVRYNPINDQITIASTADPGPGEHLLGPDNLGGIGVLIGPYTPETTCTVLTQPLPGPLPITDTPYLSHNSAPVYLARGQKQTLYSATFDARGNWLRNRAGAWSLTAGGTGLGAITPANLVPAPDGLSATFTAPAGAGSAIILVAIDGLTYRGGVEIIVS